MAKKAITEGKAALAQSISAQANFFGGRFENRYPERAGRVLEMLASGSTYTQIREAEGVDFKTLVFLKTRHGPALDKRREELAYEHLELAEGMRQLQHEKMAQLASDPEALAKTNLRDLTMSYGIAVDKFHHAMEGNKVVIEHKGSEPSLADAVKAIEEARAKLRGLSVEVKVEEIKEEAKP